MFVCPECGYRLPACWITKPRGPKTPRYVILILTEFKEFIYRRDLVERHVAAKEKGQIKL